MINKMANSGKLHAISAQDKAGDLAIGSASRVFSRDHIAQQYELVPLDTRRLRILILGLFWDRFAPTDRISHPTPAVAIHRQHITAFPASELQLDICNVADKLTGL